MSYEIENHFGRLHRWLKLESEAEKERLLTEQTRRTAADAERSGTCLQRLRIRDEYAGLAGRAIVELAKRDQRMPLPWSRLSVGSPVVLAPHENPDQLGWRGVVCQRESDMIAVALADSPEVDPHEDLRLDLSSDETTRDRQRRALDAAAKAPNDRLGRLRDVLLGLREPQPRKMPKVIESDDTLNDSQREAILHAIASEEIAVIHGPPGTGKTTTVAALIAAVVGLGEKVIACAPSNTAVDHLLEKLLVRGVKAIRLGHPARVSESLRSHTLDLAVESHADMKVARKLVKEAWALRTKAGKFVRAKPAPGAKREMREEAKSLLADARRLEKQVVESLLDEAEVVCCTLTGIDGELLHGRRFDTAVIDEAGQATEAACWAPVLRSERLILAGDPFQLPPTIISTEAEREGFAVSLLERIMNLYGERVARRLGVQYRMHREIASFSSREFYENALEADTAVAERVLSELEPVAANPRTSCPVEFIDTAGAGYDESLEPEGESRLNTAEADLVRKLAMQLLEAGVRGDDIAIITPYAAQARFLRTQCADLGIEIDSVDGFQGREKEAVIISLVRSNVEGEIGFLADVRRMNVALTRAKRKLLVVGDSATIGGHPFYSRMLGYFEEIEAYRSVWSETE